MEIYALNIKGLRKYLRMSQNDFGELIGANRGAVNQYELGNNKPKTFVTLRLCKIAGITPEDLFGREIDYNEQKVIDVLGLRGKDIDDLIKDESEQITPKEGKPYYDIDATAGPMATFNDVKEVPAAYIAIPSFKDCDFYLNVYGDSMYPKYCSGEIIACKQLTDLDIIPYGEAYLIVTKEQRLIKYIRRGSKEDCLLLKSENEKYEPFEIKRAAILNLYKIMGKIRREVT